MAPDKVPMDRLTTEDIFIFNSKLDKNGEPDVVKTSRAKTGSGSPVTASPFTKLYLGLFEQKAGVGSIVYSQSVSAVLVAMMNQTKFSIKEHEMISNIMDPVRKVPLGWEDEVVVPIVDNTDDIKALLESIKTACNDAKDTNAIIIRNNGIIVWGEDWIQARNMLESYLYLMDLSVEMKKIGFTKEGSVSTSASSVPAVETATPVAGGSKQKPTEKVENLPRRKKVETQETKKKTENSYKKPAYAKPVVDLALRKKKAALNRLRQDAIGGGHVPFSSITMSGATGQMNGPRTGPMAGPTNGPNSMNGPKFEPTRNSMDRNINGPNMGPMNNQNNRGPMGRPEPMNGPPNNMGRPGPMNGPPGMGPMNNQNNMGPMGRQALLNAPQGMGSMNGPQGMGPMNGPQGMGPMNGPMGMGPGPNNMGPGPNNMGPGPNNMGPGPNNMGPGPNNMGPGPNNMGPGPNNMGPGPNNMGPGPSTMYSPRNGPNKGGAQFNEKFNKYLKGPNQRAGGVKRSGDAASGQPPKSAKFSPKKGATKNKEKFKSVRPEDY